MPFSTLTVVSRFQDLPQYKILPWIGTYNISLFADIYLAVCSFSSQVFKILWAEPAGANLSELMGELERVIPDPTNRFYSSIRRYIVVGNDEGNCTCV